MLLGIRPTVLLLNYRPIPRQTTGIGIVAEALRPELSQLPHRFIAGGHGDGLSQRIRRQVWNQWQLPALARQAGASLIFTPVPEGYLGEQVVPQVVFVHDLRPLLHPGGGWQSLYYHALVPPLLRRCRHILTNSQFTAGQITSALGIPADHITVITLGLDQTLFSPAPAGSAAQAEPYLLQVGQHYPHKNLLRLLQAFAALGSRYPDLRLVLAGKPHPRHTRALRRAIVDLALQRRVELIPYVNQERLVALYRGALALVFPSLWEGYGLPIVEAMACGTPVLTSRGSACEEAAAGAALLVDPHSTHALRQGLEHLVSDAGLRLELRRLGLARTQHLSWEQAGLQVRSCLDALIG